MVGQLILKEAREHCWVALGVAMLAVAQYLAFLELSLRHEPPTALVAATNFVWGTGPLLAAFTARRLFVLEQEHRTIQLLRSLPVSPVLIVATKFGLGLLFNLTINLAVLWVTAGALRDQEIITYGWVGRLSVQVSVYIFAWFALATFHAQLGGYRFAVWVVFLIALVGFEDVLDNPTRTLFWTAPLADNLEVTRYATPWDAVLLGFGWAVAALVATLTLAAFRGGALVDEWFLPMSGRRRAEVAGALIVVLIGFEVISNVSRTSKGLVEMAPDNPLLHSTDADLRPLVARVDDALARLRERFDFEPRPRVLIRVRRDDRPEAVLTKALSPHELVVGVRANLPTDSAVRLVVTDILVGSTGTHWERVSSVMTWAVGFAPFALNDETLRTTAVRLSPDAVNGLSDGDALRERYGRQGVEAAGWLGWRAVAQVGGPEAVEALAHALFAESRSQTGAGLAAARTVHPTGILRAAGVDDAELETVWRQLLAAEQTHLPPAPQWDLPEVHLDRPSDGPPALSWRGLNVDFYETTVQLWWSVADDLHPRPVPQDVIRSLPIQQAEGRFPTFMDPRLRIVTAWVVEGEVMGWSEVVRP